MSKAKTIFKKYQGDGSMLVSSSASIALMSILVPSRAMTQRDSSQLLGEVWLIASGVSQMRHPPHTLREGAAVQ
ncbi:hypothetical protein SAMN05421736_107124 [Evansella caseinilytica]|uniref:Uncharacterized protein n=1 Tax=Evansella caseinilytica TaxID=1503961 RepID=A0A1H3QZN0_9BACI|nr:hypothetical protein SAMN05421736_107124 [Evansella caseinilytica]